MVSMRSEKPICAPARLSEVSPTLPLNGRLTDEGSHVKIKVSFVENTEMADVFIVQGERSRCNTGPSVNSSFSEFSVSVQGDKECIHRPQLLYRKESRSGFEPGSLCLPT